MNTLQQTFDPTALTAGIRSQSARNETYTVNILLNVQGDFITKKYDPLPFHPNMTTKRNAYPAGIIMFVPIIAFKEKDVIAEVGVDNDYKSVFTSREKFALMLKHVLKRDKSRYLVNNNDLEEKNQNYTRIVYENLNLIKEVFFKVNSIIYILGAPYLVRTVTYDPKTFHDTTTATAAEDLPFLPKKYDITFDLTVIRANENGEVPGRTCKEKAVALNKDSMKLFGKALFSDVIYSEREPKTIFVPTLGLTQEQIDWNRRNSRKDYQARTPAETKIIDSLKKLDKLQSEYDQIDKQWLAITATVHAKIFDLPEKLDKTKTDIKTITNKGTSITPYEKRNLITLQNTLKEQEEDLRKAGKELENLNLKFSETYLQKFKNKVQPILDLYDDLDKLEANLTTLNASTSSTPEQKQRNEEDIKKNIEKTTVQLGKLTKADKDKLENYINLLVLQKNKGPEEKIKQLTNKITEVTTWEDILKSTNQQKQQLQTERKNESANLRIDTETEKEIKKYILELNIIVAQLEKIEREVNPKPGEKPQFFYPIDIPKAFKDRTDLKDKYEKYTRYLNKLLGTSKKYDSEKKQINDAFQNLYAGNLARGGGQHGKKRVKTTRKIVKKVQKYKRNRSVTVQNNKRKHHKLTLKDYMLKGRRHCFTRRRSDDAKVDTHLHLRPFGGPALSLPKMLDYQKKSNILFALGEGIGQHLPVNNKCTYYKDCPGISVTPSIRNDIINAQNILESPPIKSGVVKLSMTFPDLAHPEEILPGMKFLNKEYPGMFNWMGEVNLVKQALFPNGHKAVTLLQITHWKPFMRELRIKKIPLSIHADLGNNSMPFKYLPLMQSVLKMYPKNIIIWMHLGLSKQLTNIDYAKHVHVLNDLLQKYPLLYFDISWSVLYEQVFHDPVKREYYVALLNKWPKRFLPGTDVIAGKNITSKAYQHEVHITSNILHYVNDEAYRRIALGQNFLDLLQTKKYEAPEVC